MIPRGTARMAKLELSGAVDLLRSSDSFLLCTHAGPDGDAIGSILALSHLLRGLGKRNIVCACQDPVPRIYRWLPGADAIVDKNGISGKFDLVVIVDVAQVERIGDIAQTFEADQEILILDHHLEDSPSGTNQFIDHTYASASEIVVDLYEAAGLALTPDGAVCAYVGLTTDTGGFRFGNTDARAHRVASRLVEAGVDVSDVSARVFDTISFAKAKLLEHVLGRIVVGDGGAYAHSRLTLADMTEAKAGPEDADGLVNFVRNLEGVSVGALFRELEDGKVKVSLRSRGTFNSAKVLKVFGGGGHAGAAGATFAMTCEEAESAVIDAIQTELRETQ